MLIIFIIFKSFSLNQIVPAIICAIFIIIFFTPSLAIIVRRLHDTGRSGCFIFIALIPLVGDFILLYFLCCDSQDAINEYGPSPKYITNLQDNNNQNLIEPNIPV